MTTNQKRRTNPYISISKNEHATMLPLPSDMVKAYLDLRWLANFRTGEIGKDQTRPLLISTLENLWSMPRTETQKRLDAFCAAGLVDECQLGANGQISCRLPLSIENFSTVPTACTAQQKLQSSAERIWNSRSNEIEKIISTQSNECSRSKNTLSHDSTLSAAILRRPQTNPIEPPTFEEMCDLFGTNPTSVPEQKQASTNLTPSSDYDRDYLEFDVFDLHSQPNEPVSTQKNLNKLDELKRELHNLGFQYIEGKMSQSILPRMAKLYTREEILKEAEILAKDPQSLPTPLRLTEALARTKKQSKRGKVAL